MKRDFSPSRRAWNIALTAAVWWRFARWGLARPAMRDAV